MFLWVKKKKMNDVTAVVKGTVKPLEQVDDPVFSKGLIGRGCAILPEDGHVYAPVTGTLSVVFPTGHAFGIKAADGSEYLIHIGIDTVNLQGEGFQVQVQQGDQITQGSQLVEVDLELIKAKGYQSDTIVLLTTPENQCTFQMKAAAKDHVQKESILFTCEMK